MRPYYQDGNQTIYNTDVLKGLRALDAESVRCCVTSPPYWGLRDYGTAEWDGGDAGCDHSTARSRGDDIRSGDKQGTSLGSRPNTQAECKCGAKRIDSQLGLEATPELFVAKMVEVFREVRRVLRKDGTLWMNLGDTFNSPNTHSGKADKVDWGIQRVLDAGANHGGTTKTLKPKDLCGIPWRVALALQADGWYLRSDIIEEVELFCPCGCGYVMEERIWRHAPDRDIIWKKPNPMPESVTDRPTKSHEHLFLLAKSAKYFYDADAIREPAQDWGVRDRSKGKYQNSNNKFAKRSPTYGADCNNAETGRNKRDVWTIAAQPYKGAHFAVFPEALVEPCIMAGSSVGDTVLDPFMGSGTVLKVAEQLNRNAIGIELSEDYCKLAKRRLEQGVLNLGI